ncbi:MAG: c-type cytochrome domain-containing protein [Puniceicoccaceae bacterium]
MKTSFKIQLFLSILLIVVLLGLPVAFPLNGEPTGNLGAALGRFHIILLHFPIALIFLVPALEFMGFVPRWKGFRQAAPPILYMAILFAFLASVLGWLLARGEGTSGSLVNSHMWAGFITTALLVVAQLLRSYSVHKKHFIAGAGYYLVLLLCIHTLTTGSHKGASLVHGEDYLYARLPDNVKMLIGVYEEEAPPISFDSIVYTDVIHPIFEQNCIECHGEEKVKGRFRMDTYDLLVAGGKSGMQGVVAGDADASEIVHRVSLPRDHDKAMPPVEKAPLSRMDRALLQWWIDGGALKDITIDGLANDYFPESIEAALNELMSADEEYSTLDQGSLDSVAALMKQKYGVDLIAYSQDLSDGLYVATRNASGPVSTEALQALNPVSGHIHSLNFWRQQFEGDAMGQLASFTNLRELHLNESNVTEADLKVLSSLRRLRVLNLQGTEIGDESVDTLSSLKGLKKLLLTDSKLTQEGHDRLQQNLKRCEILAFMPSLLPKKKEIEPITSETVFEPVPKWGVKEGHDHDHGMGSTHGGVVVDAAGQIYVSSHNGIFVYDDAGKMLRSYEGADYSDIHSMTLVEEDGKEFIYGARNRNAEIIKMATTGEIEMQIPFPPESGVTGKFMPTAVVVTPDDGRILVADGYGSNVIFQFDASGKYLSSFGGKDENAPEKFRTPHGLSLDRRYDPVRLLVSDREKRRLAHFDLQGNYIEDLITDLRRPCAVSIRGDYVALAELEGRVLILGKDNKIILKLGDNPDSAEWANFKVAPADWKAGVHTAPHGLSWDAKGNLYVQDWNSSGRVTKWTRKPE